MTALAVPRPPWESPGLWLFLPPCEHPPAKVEHLLTFLDVEEYEVERPSYGPPRPVPLRPHALVEGTYNVHGLCDACCALLGVADIDKRYPDLLGDAWKGFKKGDGLPPKERLWSAIHEMMNPSRRRQQDGEEVAWRRIAAKGIN